ncbi:MAG: zinc ribbon domain-containing protein [Myxococcales bacterium]|nr:zinc ribbon domain-containing protein [Myxococcales bacterium]
MPDYEFYCRRCKKQYAAWMSVKEHDERLAECPECHRTDQAEKRLSDFFARTSRKS